MKLNHKHDRNPIPLVFRPSITMALDDNQKLVAIMGDEVGHASDYSQICAPRKPVAIL